MKMMSNKLLDIYKHATKLCLHKTKVNKHSTYTQPLTRKYINNTNENNLPVMFSSFSYCW